MAEPPSAVCWLKGTWSLKIKREDGRFPPQGSPVHPFPSSALLIMFSSVQSCPPHFALLYNSTCFSRLLGDVRGIFVTFSFPCNKHLCRSWQNSLWQNKLLWATKSAPRGGNAVWIAAKICKLITFSNNMGMYPRGICLRSWWLRVTHCNGHGTGSGMLYLCLAVIFSAHWWDPRVYLLGDSLGGGYTELCIILVFWVSYCEV